MICNNRKSHWVTQRVRDTVRILPPFDIHCRYPRIHVSPPPLLEKGIGLIPLALLSRGNIRPGYRQIHHVNNHHKEISRVRDLVVNGISQLITLINVPIVVMVVVNDIVVVLVVVTLPWSMNRKYR